jgi:hypothetical protein
MSGRIGIITAPPEKRRAKNGEADVLMLTVRFSDGGTASVQWMPGAGDGTSPQKSDVVAVERFGGVLIATASMSPGSLGLKPGEREIYSRTPDGTKAARLILKTDGAAELEASSGARLGLNPDGTAGLSSMAGDTVAAIHTLKPSGKQYIGNALAGQDLYTLTSGLLSALAAFAASASTSSDTTLSAAATALTAALQPLPEALSQILEAVP